MKRMAQTKFRRGAAGQQYAILVGLIAVVAILAITQTGAITRLLFTTVGNTIQIVGNGGTVSSGQTTTTPTTPTTPAVIEIIGAGTVGDPRHWSDDLSAADCKAYRTPGGGRSYTGSVGNGFYLIDPDGASGAAAFAAPCDMMTDGGGWTVVNAITGIDGEQPIVSDTATAGNPFAAGAYNMTRAQKAAVAALATQSMFVNRTATGWMRVDRPMFDSSLTSAGNILRRWAVTLTTSTGTTIAGWMGYATYNYTGGGDFGVSVGVANGTATAGGGTTTSGFDTHNATYTLLNSNCYYHYLYSYSVGVLDNDAGYDVSSALAGWSAVTASCGAGEGGALSFYSGMR